MHGNFAVMIILKPIYSPGLDIQDGLDQTRVLAENSVAFFRGNSVQFPYGNYVTERKIEFLRKMLPSIFCGNTEFRFCEK